MIVNDPPDQTHGELLRLAIFLNSIRARSPCQWRTIQDYLEYLWARTGNKVDFQALVDEESENSEEMQ